MCFFRLEFNALSLLRPPPPPAVSLSEDTNEPSKGKEERS